MMNEELNQKDAELTQLLIEVIQNQKKNAKSLIRFLVIIVICFTIIICSMIGGFFWYESQFEYVETQTYSEQIDQEISGEGSSINNIEGNQYNGNAIHNDNRGE